MKSFYEMLVILEGSKRLNEYWWENGPPDADVPSFKKVIGEDKDDPYTAEVYVYDGGWKITGGFWVRNRLRDGSEPAISQPKFYVAGQKEKNGATIPYTGTDFENPGENLENLPEPLRSEAIKWVNKEVEWAIDNYKEDDPRDYYDRDGNFVG